MLQKSSSKFCNDSACNVTSFVNVIMLMLRMNLSLHEQQRRDGPCRYDTPAWQLSRFFCVE
jgi:hypothetical protein